MAVRSIRVGEIVRLSNDVLEGDQQQVGRCLREI